MRVHRLPAVAGLCLAMLVAAACGEEARGGTPAVSITDVELGRSIKADLSIDDATDDFRPTDVIYASVGTKGGGTAMLTARWLFEGDQLLTETKQEIAPSGPARTEFHLSKPTGLPAGRYRVDVTVNGEAAASKEFEVKDGGR